MKHYSKEELELYRNGEMSVLGKINCAAHLKECSSCARLLAELDADDEFVNELRDSIKHYETAAESK